VERLAMKGKWSVHKVKVATNRVLPFFFISTTFAITHYLVGKGLALEANPFTFALNPFTIPLAYAFTAFFVWVCERLSYVYQPKWRKLVRYLSSLVLLPNLINDVVVLVVTWLSS